MKTFSRKRNEQVIVNLVHVCGPFLVYTELKYHRSTSWSTEQYLKYIHKTGIRFPRVSSFLSGIKASSLCDPLALYSPDWQKFLLRNLGVTMSKNTVVHIPSQQHKGFPRESRDLQAMRCGFKVAWNPACSSSLYSRKITCSHAVMVVFDHAKLINYTSYNEMIRRTMDIHAATFGEWDVRQFVSR